MQHLPIADAACHARDQRRVGNRTEIFRQIRVDDFGVSLIDRLVDGSDRIERTALGTVPVGRLIEVRFENRFEHQQRCGLYHPIADRRNSERALAHTAGFRNHHPSDRLRFVAFCSNRLSQFVEPALHSVCFDATEGLAVHAWGPAVRTAAGVGVGYDVFTPHFVIEEVEPPRRLLLGLHIERSLELPNLFRSCQAHANLLLLARSSAPRTRAPFLLRRYPGSSVVWAPATPVGPVPRGGVAKSPRQSEQVSRVASHRLCVRAAPHTPASRTTVTCRCIWSSSAAFVFGEETRRSHYSFRGLLGLHSRCGPHAC